MFPDLLPKGRVGQPRLGLVLRLASVVGSQSQGPGDDSIQRPRVIKVEGLEMDYPRDMGPRLGPAPSRDGLPRDGCPRAWHHLLLLIFASPTVLTLGCT